MQAEERRIWRCTESMGKEREAWVNRRKKGEEKRERLKKNNVCVFVRSTLNFLDYYFSPSSSFSSVSSSNCPLRHKASNQKASAGPCPTNSGLHGLLWTWICPQIFLSLSLALSLSPSFLFLSFTLFIPHWLTCFTSTAVISTAFTELINGAGGWVLLNWDNSSLSLAHMDNYIEKRREAV